MTDWIPPTLQDLDYLWRCLTDDGKLSAQEGWRRIGNRGQRYYRAMEKFYAKYGYFPDISRWDHRALADHIFRAEGVWTDWTSRVQY